MIQNELPVLVSSYIVSCIGYLKFCYCNFAVQVKYVTVSAKTVPIGTTIEIHFMA